MMKPKQNDEALGRVVVREFLHRKLVESKHRPEVIAELPAWARNAIALTGQRAGIHHTELAKVVTS